MNILGIDPGTSLIGIGIIEKNRRELTSIHQEAFITPSNINNIDRFDLVYDFFNALLKKIPIDLAGIEKIYFSKNTKTAIQVSEVRGVILLALKKNRIPILEFTPNEIKLAVSGYGAAQKSQVQKMVQLILSLKELPTPDDVADALAIAICSANTNPQLI
ncbi:MAG: crossover junction endodeoxyribonuclease RuvC [Candidatus Yanofskybacteria bacterium CG10_big_fil_rev_8_21_14_0_10_46_23]|uniref:Crossover junction endodeoxyribonuclease RuvC n=1 Tax=Candidatus Yanofskybacteria bacterium CG10_big_fil_rev_8_21_14_0_10_46_23 TaxID=1975098 RepID=A0A2H0R4D0_9BACT|nr:MAG: crossover junction endodeoxyribonuclease RuvC [Candidatus Yanofskybacteria bacterium CG10_big_fil_rev_8_21_14_0_10_46_23]